MPIRLIAGLGNPGKQYESTRHNAGFWVLERFAVREHVGLRKDPKYEAYVGRHSSGAWLVLPQTFMNLSGKAVALLAGFFKIPAAEVLVVHDELDFEPGVVKLKQGGGIAGHNGLKDISARLGSHDYWRLRIGIGHPGVKEDVADYVLGRPAPEDREAIDAAIERALDVLPICLGGDMQAAMLKLHSIEKRPEKSAKEKREPENAEKEKREPQKREAAAAKAKGKVAEEKAPAQQKKAEGEKSLLSSLLGGGAKRRK